MPALVNALNNVDFPTFGKPTIPHFKLMTDPQRQTGKCMPSAWRAFAGLLLALAFALPGWAAAPRTAAVLADTAMQIDAHDIAEAWFDARGTATLEQVLQGSAGASFQPARADQIWSLGE